MRWVRNYDYQNHISILDVRVQLEFVYRVRQRYRQNLKRDNFLNFCCKMKPMRKRPYSRQVTSFSRRVFKILNEISKVSDFTNLANLTDTALTMRQKTGVW